MTKIRETITGQKFGRLTVVAQPFKTPDGLAVPTICRCGQEKPIFKKHLLSGAVKSCGCLRREVNELLSPFDETGQIKYIPRREYHAFVSAAQRCVNPKAHKFETCGGSGVKFHEPWLGDFPAFYRDMGPAGPGQILTRKNLKGNFEPGNCFWGNWRDIGRNTVRNRKPLLVAA